MKAKLGLALTAIGVAIIFASQQNIHDKSNANHVFSAQQVSSQSTHVDLDRSFFPSASNSNVTSNSGTSHVTSASSVVISSANSLSGMRVEPLPEIANFLHQLDSVVIPKIYLPTPKRDYGFDYAKAKPSELKDRALDGDPYAAYFYAEFIVKNKVRSVTDTGAYAYEADDKKRTLARNEAREFYIRGFRGGIASIADVLSRLYAMTPRGGNRVESLAWRKISFAVGEGERYDCLRNSTTCFVKDFNNMNRLEFFYPCLSVAGDSCTQSDYDAAMLLALQYADSLEFALNNKPAN